MASRKAAIFIAGATTFSKTVISTVSVKPAYVAVIVACPAATACKFAERTLTTPVLLDVMTNSPLLIKTCGLAAGSISNLISLSASSTCHSAVKSALLLISNLVTLGPGSVVVVVVDVGSSVVVVVTCGWLVELASGVQPAKVKPTTASNAIGNNFSFIISSYIFIAIFIYK